MTNPNNFGEAVYAAFPVSFSSVICFAENRLENPPWQFFVMSRMLLDSAAANFENNFDGF